METTTRTASLEEKRRWDPARVTWLAAIVLFIASFVVRFVLADFPKGIGVLPDEIRYIDLASSLFNHGELIERGGYASFQKILYPLSLFPAFLADDPQVRVRIIAALNSLYLSSALFPALLLARRLFKGALPVLICLLFTLIMPDMAYSMTFLSECVYLPLVLWIVWLALVTLGQKGSKAVVASAGLGLLCFAAYLAKEVALGFVLAFTLMLVLRMARAGKGERRSAAVNLTAFLAPLVIAFISLKLTLFSGLLNSYDQANPSVLLDPYTILFALYALASDATHFAIAFMFFPLAIPAFTWSRLSEEEKELYLFCILSFAFILLAVVYTISIREDLGHVGIRPHVRYVAPLFLPLLFLTIKQLWRNDGLALLERAPRFLGFALLTLAMGLFSLGFLGTGDYSQGFDYAQFHMVRMADESFEEGGEEFSAAATVDEDDIYHGDAFEINPVIWLFKLGFCLYLAFGVRVYTAKRHHWIRVVYLALIALVMIGNTVGAYLYNYAVYRISEEDAREFAAVDGFIDSLEPDAQVLIVCDEGSSHFNNLMDVYVDNDALNCSYIESDSFKDLVSAGSTPKEILVESDATMGDNIFKANGRTNVADGGIRYVIMSATNHSAFLSGETACDDTPENWENVVRFWIPSDGELMLASSTRSTPLR